MQFLLSGLYYAVVAICFLGLPYYFFFKKKEKMLGGALLVVNFLWILNIYLSYSRNPIENDHGSVILGMLLLFPILPLVSDFIFILLFYFVRYLRKK